MFVLFKHFLFLDFWRNLQGRFFFEFDQISVKYQSKLSFTYFSRDTFKQRHVCYLIQMKTVKNHFHLSYLLSSLQHPLRCSFYLSPILQSSTNNHLNSSCKRITNHTKKKLSTLQLLTKPFRDFAIKNFLVLCIANSTELFSLHSFEKFYLFILVFSVITSVQVQLHALQQRSGFDVFAASEEY